MITPNEQIAPYSVFFMQSAEALKITLLLCIIVMLVIQQKRLTALENNLKKLIKA